MSDDNWYSDAALAKLAAISEKPASELRISDLAGIWEPRVPCPPELRCVCCGGDGRTEVGGNERYCGLCIDRGHDEDDA